MLTFEEFEELAIEWGRWLNDRSDCYPEPVGCASLESAYRSPQCWGGEEPKQFPNDPDEHAAYAFERVATSGVLDWRQKQVIDTHYVTLPWWRLEQRGIPEAVWMEYRVRHARCKGMADYLDALDVASMVLREAIEAVSARNPCAAAEIERHFGRGSTPKKHPA